MNVLSTQPLVTNMMYAVESCQGAQGARVQPGWTASGPQHPLPAWETTGS